MGKKILGIPKHHANLCPLVALGWPSMRLRILKRKLMFLLRLTRPDNSSISAKEPLIAQQCRLLEHSYGTNLTSSLLDEENAEEIRSILKKLENADQTLTRTEVEKKPSLTFLSHPICWTKLWDTARDYGIQGSRSLLAVLTVLSTPTFQDHTCPYCDTIITNQHFAEHVT